jgi:hypothetical protein
MAKKLITYYTFEPTTNTVKVKGNIPAKRLLLVTNVTDNVNIYNFADAFLGLGSRTYDKVAEETTFVLNFNCSTMQSTDELQIFYEKDYVNIEPSETYVDAVSKFRVSNPENLVDTDFEYGPQASKWETIQTINNIPSFYASTADTTIPFISGVTSTKDSEIITVTCEFEHGLATGVPITVTGLSSLSAEGAYLIQSVPSNETFTYKARANQPETKNLQGTYTSIIPGKFFQGSQVNLSSTKGITSDLFRKTVIVKPTIELTATTAFDIDVLVGATATTPSAIGKIAKVDGSTITVIDIELGAFAVDEPLTITGAAVEYTIESTANNGVVDSGNRYFIGNTVETCYLEPDFTLIRNSIYIFDQSDVSNNNHPLEFADAATGGNVHSTYVYANGTPGTAGAYTRILITSAEPSYNTLYYRCQNHAGMGSSYNIVFGTNTKVLLTTRSEHGFADNTNFYFVNTVSPKVLEVPDSTVTAPDGRPTIDHVEQANIVTAEDPTQRVPYNYESTYTKRFDETDINYGSDSITMTSHGFHNRAAVLYYPNPGDLPIGGLSRMQVYYIERIDDNSFYLNHSQRMNYRLNLSSGGTFAHGSHNLGLVYNIESEYSPRRDFYVYYRTYYRSNRNTYSGYDFASVDGTYGLGRTPWDVAAFFCTTRYGDGISSNHSERYLMKWDYYRRGYEMRTYGYHHETLPLGNTQWQGTYDFLTDHENQGVNGNNNGNYSYGYVSGGYQGRNSKTYWTNSSCYLYDESDYQFRLNGNEWYYWYYQSGYDGDPTWNFRSVNEDGQTNQYIALLKRNTSTNDSFYKQNHGFNTNDSVVLSSTGAVHYYYNNAGNRTSTSSGTWYIDRINNDRFRIKSSTGASPMRLAGATGTTTFTAVLTNPSRNSIYIADNQFSAGELLKYNTTGVAPTGSPGLVDGTSYYVYPISGNRFTLSATQGGSMIDITSSGSGAHTFENTTADFGVVDGSYTTTTAISETELEVTIPFKIPPTSKAFNSNTDVDIVDMRINIPNHFFGTGTRVIYDNNGGTDISGLTNNTDYYVIVLDHNFIKLAATEADATAEPPVPLAFTSTGSGLQRFISSNLSGEVTGAGTIETVSGSRSIIGTDTSFERFFKVGDTIKLVDVTGGTPGTIKSRIITAITDDNTLLVETAVDFTATNVVYLIPSYIYVRPDGFYLHRPFDGGMEIGTSKSPNSKISRQTRKYFRYQSGKGIQTSYAINFIPLIPVLDLSYATRGTTVSTAATGTQGDDQLTVADTSGIIPDMKVTGSGIGLTPEGGQTRVIEVINSTTLRISSNCEASLVSETLVFHEIVEGLVTTSKPHNLTNQLDIKIIESDDQAWNISSNVTSIQNDYEFKYLLDVEPARSNSGGFPKAQVLSWSGCDIRAGMFDDQNGFFYEFNGQTLNCVRRSSVLQLPGTVSVTNQDNIVTGTNTKFLSELNKGEQIVIRGMSYRVVKVTSNTQVTVQPAYRGVTAENVICTKTIDTKVGQPDWNVDKADGNGPSGFDLDVSKIQMCYMDYSWYGAGKIRFGFKDQNGHVKYVHEFKHNNRLTESYFRSGNLPARYEIENNELPSYVGTLFHWGTSVIMDGMYQDDEAYLFTASGNVQKFTNESAVDKNTQSNTAIRSERYQGSYYYREYFLVLFFQQSDASAFATNTLLYHNTIASGYFQTGRAINSRSRNGSSYYEVYIQYFEGTNAVFNRYHTDNIQRTLCGSNGCITVPSGTTMSIGAPSGTDNPIPQDIPLISIRLAPSVDSSITGALGEREIVNRMQLKLASVGILTTHETEISLKLNGRLSTDAYQNVQEPSLCQLVRHSSNETVAGGSTILSFRAAGGGTGESTSTAYDLSQISALGNSILGGDGTFPNGPDILTVVAKIVDATGVSTANPFAVSARVTWQESQA